VFGELEQRADERDALDAAALEDRVGLMEIRHCDQLPSVRLSPAAATRR
jgi:hypothetical protein